MFVVSPTSMVLNPEKLWLLFFKRPQLIVDRISHLSCRSMQRVHHSSRVTMTLLYASLISRGPTVHTFFLKIPGTALSVRQRTNAAVFYTRTHAECLYAEQNREDSPSHH
ncbi:hypothetical protein ATANTOWER_022309 [Ataeniobius toweri]|uniref:Uncharacterized protein n=1 Tax=Ataeniobius toweri TaxID=208326 RepID=A0ABU7BNA8_9TELE|nr:hypothetical protein [Ataeniobius toweri]